VTADAPAARLAEFLDARGTTPERLLASVETSFGTPLLVVATGSVLHGFGNKRSDLDLNVVVDRDTVKVVPIPAFEGDLLVDTKFFTVSQLREWTTELRDGRWPPAGHLTRDGYRRRHLLLFHCMRFAEGVELSSTDGSEPLIGDLHEPWLVERVVEWWRSEHVRWSLAARWLAEAKPLVAAQRWCEAVLAALECRAARAGESYFKPKWISEKLRRLGDEEGLAVLEAALRVPTTRHEAPAYSALCEELLQELDSHRQEGLAAQLWYAPGVTVQPLGTGTLVTRRQLRGLELEAKLPIPDGDEPIWEGPVEDTPDPHVLELFVEDMTWLSVVVSKA
jgi:hypothetical protein